MKLDETDRALLGVTLGSLAGLVLLLAALRLFF